MSASSSSGGEPAREAPTPRERFAAALRREPAALFEGCLAIAAHLGHPDDPDESRATLDALAAHVRDAAVGVRRRPTLETVAAELFGPLGFDGNHARYDDPANSLLPEVLRRRVGIPITLAVVVLEVADRLEVEACGVGMPGHFLVAEGPRASRWLDGFERGRWLDRAGVEARFAAVHGPGAPFRDEYLRPTPPGQMLVRVLANLLGVSTTMGDPNLRLRVLELRSEVEGLGATPQARVDLAEAQAAVGRLAEAAEGLEAVRRLAGLDEDTALARRVDQLRARLN
jgi:regulator of sirC expression with transglutaminase-like and TPR domain